MDMNLPLPVRRGKLLNVREANLTKVVDNAEIQNIKQIMGLQHGKVWILGSCRT